MTETLPLFRRFPALQELPYVSLVTLPTPVERVSERLWIKRDDLTHVIPAPAPSEVEGEAGIQRRLFELGGSKVRALEFVFGGTREGDDVLTVGGHGSTHILTTAFHGRRLGLVTDAIRWPHEMHPVANRVDEMCRALCRDLIDTPNILVGLARAALRRGSTDALWVPLGASDPVGVLGHVNAGLELADQVVSGACPAPAQIVVPLGSGGIAAGLALGVQLAGLDTTVIAVRVAPRIATGLRRVRKLARQTGRLIGILNGKRVPRLSPGRVRVEHDFYGGAYGRPLAAEAEAGSIIGDAVGVKLDSTYSGKAAAAAMAISRRDRGATLFWLTFDGRWLSDPQSLGTGGP